MGVLEKRGGQAELWGRQKYPLKCYGAYATDATCFKAACKEAAEGGVVSIAPGRAAEAKSPQGAFAGREAWRKQGIERMGVEDVR